MADNPFKLFINNAAKTKKEIEDEIQRVIRFKIEKVVDNAMQKAQEHAAEKIPPRDTVFYGKKPQANAELLSADEIAYAPESPDSSAPDLLDKIHEMRELGQTFHNGYMLRQCAEITIVKQGEFMQDVTDDFGRSAFCSIERPIYGALSLEQLRTYFTWRTDARKGTYYRIDKSYVVLYCYELMNKIGVLSSMDSFNRLVDVWENCREFCPYLDSVMPFWLRDYYAYNNIDVDFSELEKSFPVQSQRSDTATAELLAGDYRNKLEYLMEHSSYNLKGSIFLSDETRPLFESALEKVLAAMSAFLEQYDVTLFELICGRSRKDHIWTPFANAYVNLDRMDGFRTCNISATERYCIKRGQPCHERFEQSPYRNFIGYILKSTEAVLRERTGFRYSILPNLSLVLDDFCNRDKLYKLASTPEFPSVIPDAVNEWCDQNAIYPKPKEKKRKKKQFVEDDLPPEYGYSPSAPPPVEIDIANLENIRAAADEIARKLIIEEDAAELSTEESIAEMTARIEDDVFEERTELAASEVHSEYDFSSLSEEWRSFAESLDAQTLRLLKALYEGTAEALCHELGLLPETAYEELNAVALEHIGDYLVEGGQLIPDYSEDAAAIAALIT